MRVWRDGIRTVPDSRAGRGLVPSGFLGAVRLLAVGLLGVVSMELVAATRRPYLPTVGPLPIRFGEPISAEAARVSLPPLDMGWSNVVAQIAEPSKVERAAPGVEPMETATLLDLGADPFAGLPAGEPPVPPRPVVTAVPEPPPPPPPEPQLVQPLTAEAETISPRAILKYLVRPGPANATTGVFGGTNGVSSVGVIAPIGFQPPAPVTPSSATYSVTPSGSK